MPIATFRGERSVTELADKLFARLTPRQREKAEAELLKANPQLRDIANLRDGSVLRVPDIPELRPKTNRSLDNPDAQITNAIGEALRDYGGRLEERVKQEVANSKTQTTLLKSAAFKRALGNAPALTELAAQAGKALAERPKALEARHAAVEEAIRALVKDLNKGFG
jgi:hypothetical protein